MKRNWVKLRNRALLEYRQGIKDFLDFAFEHTTMGDKIYCPCKKCNNYFANTRDNVEANLLTIGILPSYTHWFRHGEERHFQTCDSLDSDDELDGDGFSEMVEDYYAAFNAASCVAGDSSGDSTPEEPNDDVANFFLKLGDNKQKLFLDCKYTKLSFIVKLLHIKCLSGWTNKSFTILLQFLNNALSKAIGELQNSFYEAKKMIRDLDLGYVKIDACEENCMLYWKENANRSDCQVCGRSRWKSSSQDIALFSSNTKAQEAFYVKKDYFLHDLAL